MKITALNAMWNIWVGNRTKEQFFFGILLRLFNFRSVFYVKKCSPLLRMVRKSFHKAGITVFAGMGASHIRVDRVIADRQVRFCQNAFYIYSFDNRFQNVTLI